MENVLTILLAGGKGTRLDPLTRDRAKPAVPFGGMYRIVDFALSNCLNSRLLQHPGPDPVQVAQPGAPRRPGVGPVLPPRVRPVAGRRAPPSSGSSEDWYLGTANAVYQNIYSIEKSGAEHVLVLAADHVYKMDYRRMLAFHRGPRRGGDGRDPPRARWPRRPGSSGWSRWTPTRGWRGSRRSRSARPRLPGDEGHCLASMGIYVFTARFLIDELRRNAEGADPGHDFGHHILPRLIGREPVRAFTFSGRGTGAPGYWRDVGTVDAYFRANMDLLADAPGLDLYDKAWPIYSFQPSFPPPRVAVVPEPAGRPGRRPAAQHLRERDGGRGLAAGGGGRVRLPDRAGTRWWRTASCSTGCASGRGAEVRRAILDKGVQVRPGARVGFDPDEDRGGGSW